MKTRGANLVVLMTLVAMGVSVGPAGFAGSPEAHEETQDEAGDRAQDEAEDSGQKEAVEGKALVIFYREKSVKGAAIRFNLNQGQDPIGALPSGSVLKRYVEPGEYTFWSQALSKDSVTLNAVAGESYYIKGVVKMGVVVGRPRLTIMPESKAKPAIAKLK